MFVFLHTCKNIHWVHVCERWMCASVKIEKSNRMYWRNMTDFVEGIGVTFSVSLLFRHTKFFMFSYVKRLALISCAFYSSILINLCILYVFKMTWETACSKTSLSLLSIKIGQNCVYLLGRWDQKSVKLFFFYIDRFLHILS